MNYIGSKTSLLNFLLRAISKVAGSNKGKNPTFADLFAGTGVVAAAFRAQNYHVIANDLQYYSFVLCQNLLRRTEDISSDHLHYLNQLDGITGFISENYCPRDDGSGRRYFTNLNGQKIDTIRQEIEHWSQSKQINSIQYYSLLASLLIAADKVANTASVYSAYLKHFKTSAQKPLTLLPPPDISGNIGQVYQQNANDLITSISGDILYLDPPYNARQYSTNYHLLETIARYDNPTLHGLTGLRADNQLQKSHYCSKRQVAHAFADLIKNAQFPYIFLSYNNEGLMSAATIKQIMSAHGKYSLFTTKHRRFRADDQNARHHRAATTTEYLHVLQK